MEKARQGEESKLARAAAHQDDGNCLQQDLEI